MAKSFVSPGWFTVIDDDGVRFLLPERDSSSKQIDVDADAFKGQAQRCGKFDSLNYEGESTGDVFLAWDTKGGVTPATVTDTQKARVLRKQHAKNDRVIIETSKDASPLDYVILDSRFGFSLYRFLSFFT